jgi:two-component system, response regulator
MVDILLVEDNPNDIDLILRAFKKQHVANHVHVAKDGADALEFLFCGGPYAGRDNSNQPKVILLDLKLPKIEGIEVLKAIKADERTCNLPVVIVTASQNEQDIKAAYALGANSCMVKPVEFEAFVEAVRHLVLYWLFVNHPAK